MDYGPTFNSCCGFFRFASVILACQSFTLNCIAQSVEQQVIPLSEVGVGCCGRKVNCAEFIIRKTKYEHTFS